MKLASPAEGLETVPADGDAMAANQAWARPGVTVRLSDRRRSRLQALAKGFSPLLSPTAAIDHAIELATRAAERDDESVPRIDSASGLAEIASLIERRAAEHALALTDIETDMKRLSELLTAALTDGNREPQDSHAGPPSIRAWAEQEAKRLPRPTFLAKALWQATKRLDHTHVAVDLLVERVAAADLKGPSARGHPAMVRLGFAPKASAFGKCDAMEIFFLMFRGGAHAGWNVGLHSMDADGALTPALAVLDL